MDNIVHLLILSFATLRLGNLLSWEAGPYGILHAVRNVLGVRYNELNKPYSDKEIGKLVLCIRCNTVWIGFFMGIMYYLVGDVLVIFSLPFALSAIAIVFDHFS